MTEWLERAGAWYEGRVRRERLLVIATLVALIVFAWSSLLLTPLEERQEAAEERIDTHRERLQALAGEQAEVAARMDEDPDAALREEIAALEAELAAVEDELEARLRRFVAPGEMVAVLRRLVAAEEGVRLARLATLPATTIFDEEGLRIYRHGVELELDAEYAGLLRYLEALESGDGVLAWDRLDYQVTDHPRARVRIRVHTLGLEEPALGL